MAWQQKTISVDPRARGQHWPDYCLPFSPSTKREPFYSPECTIFRLEPQRACHRFGYYELYRMISSTTLVLVDKGVSKNAHIRISIPFLVFLQSATQFPVCHLLQSGCYVISLKHRSIVKAQSARFCDSLAPVLGRTSERHTIPTYKNPRNCQYLSQHCSPSPLSTVPFLWVLGVLHSVDSHLTCGNSVCLCIFRFLPLYDLRRDRGRPPPQSSQSS